MAVVVIKTTFITGVLSLVAASGLFVGCQNRPAAPESAQSLRLCRDGILGGYNNSDVKVSRYEDRGAELTLPGHLENILAALSIDEKDAAIHELTIMLLDPNRDLLACLVLCTLQHKNPFEHGVSLRADMSLSFNSRQFRIAMDQ